MKKALIGCLCGAAALAGCRPAYTGDCDLKSNKDSISYALGTFVGMGLTQQMANFPLDGLDSTKMAAAVATLTPNQRYRTMVSEQLLEDDSLDVNLFRYGMVHQIYSGGKRLKISMETAEEICNRRANLVRQHKEEEQRKIGDENRAKGAEYMSNNLKNDSVKQLPCGVQYKVITKGKGAQPKDGDRVKCHYQGRLIDGTVFDSSYERNEPSTFGLNGVIKGWTETLKEMREGDKWQIVIPDSLAYADHPQRGGKIGPGETLIFDIELIEVVKPATKKK